MIPDGLTVTFGVGSTLFDSRYGLAASRPLHLTPMKSFPNDDLDPAQCGGDIVLQLSAGDTDTVLHALRDIAKNTRGGMQANWRINGFSSPAGGRDRAAQLARVHGRDREPGRDVSRADGLAGVGEPLGFRRARVGGRGHLLRGAAHRMFVEFWDRVDIEEQETMIGRRRGTGFPLDGTSLHSIPDYPADPTGDVIPLTAHMRLANPRTPESASSVILRQAYNYNRGLGAVGDLDMGLIFTCFQQDIKQQFETVQTRLIGEPLVDYISPFGGGYFLALPGVTGPSDFYGRSLLA